ncbi:Ribonuclease P protein component [hydrothermal vent metagenome]|uniref:Ribonuclease P protein component n=1 Tax=hydrothermal vent metagenome TaxID=652676 RepID=A0A3B0WQA3_9ZZZZ
MIIAQVISSLSFGKQAKLLKAADYNHVFDKSIRSSDRYFTVLARSNVLPHARLGMAFSKKRVKRAVARNRLKRISRESFRLTLLAQTSSKKQQEKQYADYIVLAGAQCEKATNQQLLYSLEKHWLQLNKKCENE